jgi:hypothetical protein
MRSAPDLPEDLRRLVRRPPILLDRAGTRAVDRA